MMQLQNQQTIKIVLHYILIKQFNQTDMARMWHFVQCTAAKLLFNCYNLIICSFSYSTDVSHIYVYIV